MIVILNAINTKSLFSSVSFYLQAIGIKIISMTKILHKLLISKHACICGDIVDELPLSQSTVSQHLKELKDAGLIQGEIEGAKVCYCIDAKEWKSARERINQLFDAYKGNECC